MRCVVSLSFFPLSASFQWQSSRTARVEPILMLVRRHFGGPVSSHWQESLVKLSLTFCLVLTTSVGQLTLLVMTDTSG